MIYIFILLLQSNKYYVGKTTNPEFELNLHFNSNDSKWTQTYNPIEVVEIIENCDTFDEDKYVLKYMNSKGIDNVRGGSFSQIELSNEQIELIEKMIKGANNECSNSNELQDKLNNYLSKIDEDNVDQEIEKINNLLQLLNNINEVIKKTDHIKISDLPEIKKDYMIINKYQRMNQELEKLRLELHSIRQSGTTVKYQNTQRKIDNTQIKIRTFQQENHQVNGQSKLINIVRNIISNLSHYERSGYLKLKTIYMGNNELQALEIITLNLNHKMKLKNIFKDYYNKEFIENYLSELYQLKISYLEENLKF